MKNKISFESREEWLRWRKGHIGGSDAAAIMGVSKWMTPLDLYEDKTNPDKIDEGGNYITAKGNDMESRILSLFCLSKKIKMEPIVIENQDEGLEFLSASLDAATEDLSEVAEIKLMGEEDWTALRDSKIIPKHYYPQCIHNLIVSGAKVLHFIAYLYLKDDDGIMDKKRLAYVSLQLKDHVEYADKQFNAVVDFWNNHVVKKVPPPLTDKDYKQLGESKVVKKYLEVKEKIKVLEEELKELETSIKEKADSLGHVRYTCSGVRIRKEERKGSIDYAKIPEIKKMEADYLEKYRKAGSSFWKIETIRSGSKED